MIGYSRLSIGLLACSLLAVQVRAEMPTQEADLSAATAEVATLVTISPLSKFAMFKVGGKFPVMTICDPVAGSIETIALGVTDKPGAASRAPIADEDLGRLIARSQTVATVDNTIEKKETVFKAQEREALLANGITNLLRGIGAIEAGDYKGTPFIDQFYDKVPMWWVVKTPAQAKVLAQYVAAMLGSEAAEPKSALCVDIRNGGQLDEETTQLLSRYFNLVTVDSKAYKVFKKLLKHHRRIEKLIKDAKPKASDDTEEWLRSIENDWYKLDGKKTAYAATKWVLICLTAGLVVELAKPWISRAADKCKDCVPCFNVDKVFPKPQKVDPVVAELQGLRADLAGQQYAV